MKKGPTDWLWLVDIGEDIALEIAEAAIRERKKQKSRRRLR